MITDKEIEDIKRILLNKMYAGHDNDVIQDMFADYLILRKRYCDEISFDEAESNNEYK